MGDRREGGKAGIELVIGSLATNLVGFGHRKCFEPGRSSRTQVGREIKVAEKIDNLFEAGQFASFHRWEGDGATKRMGTDSRRQVRGERIAQAGCTFFGRASRIIAARLAGNHDGEQPCSRRHSLTRHD